MSDLQKERREFEEWVKAPGHPEGGYKLDKTASGAYINPEARCAWRGWLGRAQLAAAAPVAVPQTDLQHEIARDAEAFEAALGYKPMRVKSTAYPWGWCYVSKSIRNQFKDFCTMRDV